MIQFDLHSLDKNILSFENIFILNLKKRLICWEVGIFRYFFFLFTYILAGK